MPIVNALGLAAVMVPDPPSEIGVPLTVTALFANWALETVPDKLVVGIVADAVAGDAPLPNR